MEQLLNRKTVRGRTYYLVLWQGHASAADSWEPAEHLANCQERVAEYEAAAPRRPKALRAHQRAGTAPLAQAVAPPARLPPPAAAPPPTPARMGCGGRGPSGPRLRPPLLVAGRGLTARAHPAPGCWRAPFTHVVGYRTPTAAFAGEVHTLLDPATCGSRWVSLTRGAPSGR